jgi:hypothetical protein
MMETDFDTSTSWSASINKQVFALEKGQNPANIPAEDEQKVAVNLPAQRLSCFYIFQGGVELL